MTQAVAAANDTEFGLVGYLFTRDLNRALRVSEALESGMVGLNTGLVSNPAAPFGGIKQSGLGREGGALGIEEYLETKYVAIGFGIEPCLAAPALVRRGRAAAAVRRRASARRPTSTADRPRLTTGERLAPSEAVGETRPSIPTTPGPVRADRREVG